MCGRFVRVCCGLGFLFLWATPQGLASQQLIFHAATEIVTLDVSVVDKDRRPIRDLTKADFTILEDGRPQPLVAFSAVDVPELSVSDQAPAKAQWTRDVAGDITANALPSDGRLFVLLFDDALIPAEPRILATAKQIGHDIVGHLGGNDRMAVVFSESSQSAQDFTTDEAKLLAAVDGVTSRAVALHVRVGDGRAASASGSFRRWNESINGVLAIGAGAIGPYF